MKVIHSDTRMPIGKILSGVNSIMPTKATFKALKPVKLLIFQNTLEQIEKRKVRTFNADQDEKHDFNRMESNVAAFVKKKGVPALEEGAVMSLQRSSSMQVQNARKSKATTLHHMWGKEAQLDSDYKSKISEDREFMKKQYSVVYGKHMEGNAKDIIQMMEEQEDEESFSLGMSSDEDEEIG